MPGGGIEDLVGGREKTTPGRSNIARGEVLDAPATNGDDLRIVIPSFSGELVYEVPASQWASLPNELPAAKDTCVVLFDDEGDVWVPVWEGEAYVPDPGSGPAGPAGPAGAAGAAGPALHTWVAQGLHPVLVSQTEFRRGVGAADWNTALYSLEGHVRGAFMTARPRTAAQYGMIGLNSDPATDASYASLDFAWYTEATGTLYIFENGASLGSFGTWDVNTVLAITYDGVNVRYWRNGVVARTVARAIGSALHLDSSLYSEEAGFRDVHFGPMGEQGPQGPQGPQGAAGSGGVTTRTEQHTWAIPGTLAVWSSGATDFILPMFVKKAVGETLMLTEFRAMIRGGTSATVKLVRTSAAGTDTDYAAGTVVTPTPADTAVNLALSDNERIRPQITAISGAPDGLVFTIELTRTI